MATYILSNGDLKNNVFQDDSGSYAWLWEGDAYKNTLRGMTDEEIKTEVRSQAETMHDVYQNECWEVGDGFEPLGFNEFLAESDYAQAVKAMCDARDELNSGAVNFQSIGERYAIESDYTNADDAWEHAISNDLQIIEALRGLDTDERASAAEDFGQGFADVLQAEKAEIEEELNTVMTAAEAAETFELAEATVRQAINRGQIPARKSAGTWLIRREDAEKKWGK